VSIPKCGIDGKPIAFGAGCHHYTPPAQASAPEPEASLDEFAQNDSGEPIPFDRKEIENFFHRTT